MNNFCVDYRIGRSEIFVIVYLGKFHSVYKSKDISVFLDTIQTKLSGIFSLKRVSMMFADTTCYFIRHVITTIDSLSKGLNGDKY